MKKLLMVLAFVGVATTTMAQETTEDPTLKYSVATNSFWSNWFIQVGVTGNSWLMDEQNGDNSPLSNSPFKDWRTNIGFSAAVGKWFTPGLGLRTKFQGFNAKRVQPTNFNNPVGDSFKAWTLNEHVLFNLSNLLCGYNESRVWNVIPFAGGGISRNCKESLYAMQLSFGLLNTWRLSNKLRLHAELGWNRLEEDFDWYEGAKNANTHDNRGWDDKDNQLYAEIGLTFNLGKGTWNKTPDVDAIKALSQSQLDALNAQLADANAANNQLQKELADAQAKAKETKLTESVKELIATPVSVFFNLAKTDVASQKDLVNVRALAKYAIENDRNILVTGYADSATGSKEINNRLSVKRAEVVKGELIKMGVNADKISTRGLGGVEQLQPIEFNRRATVQITE